MVVEFKTNENFNWFVLILGIVMVSIAWVTQYHERHIKYIENGYIQSERTGSSLNKWIK